MRTILVLATLLVMGATFTLFAQDQQPSTKEQLKSDAPVALSEISIPTAVCNNCAETITDALKAVKGVESVDIDLEKKVASVRYDPKFATLPQLEKAIANAGYDANYAKRSPDAYEALPSCCK
jgi:mercuric ion binding protein